MENANPNEFAQPDANSNQSAAENEATIPENLPNENSEPKIPVKFNKEIREITLGEAQSLAQKGMKYDTVCDALERLRKMAAGKGKNVNDYLTMLEQREITAHKNELLGKCSGDEKLVDEILSLQGNKESDFIGLKELMNKVDSIKSIDDIPEPVLLAAKEKGGNLFDEYLRYQFEQNRKVNEADLYRINAEKSTTGPISTGTPVDNAVGIQFLKAIWN